MFDASQYATLRAVVDRMIPVDDAPGGLDAEVDRYLLTLLQRETGLIPTYTAALPALPAAADNRHHRRDTGEGHALYQRQLTPEKR